MGLAVRERADEALNSLPSPPNVKPIKSGVATNFLSVANANADDSQYRSITHDTKGHSYH